MVRARIVHYECGACLKVHSQVKIEPLYQCAVCSIFLCPDCDHDGLCPRHYEVLNSKDKDTLATFAGKEEDIRARARIVLMVVWMVGGLGGGLVAAFLLMAVQPSFPIFHFDALIWGSILLAGMVVVRYYRSQLAAQRETIKITVKGILLKYPELAAILEEREGPENEAEPPSQDEEP